ncbi:MAG: transcriptional regulator [Bacteroidetes bacterium B1(2017)]|nr:MAG: transcriptional regulator [Bacteroidetes bacterium B1(2017)]
MNRIDRIAAILIHLQSKKLVRGQDIANRFGISLRTVYRDIKTLEEAGVPIISDAGIGYSLVEGYRLPPIMFTKEEAIAFLTAEKLVEKLTDEATAKLYQSALYKIKAVLRNDEKEHLENMYQHIAVLDSPYIPKQVEWNTPIQSILKSISLKTVLSIEYSALHSQQNTSRTIEPIGIFLNGNNWYVIAYCWLRKDYRTFRLDRISKTQFLDQEFKKQHPPLNKYLKELTKENRELQKVVLRINKSAHKYLGEQKYYHGFVSETEVKDQIEMTFLCSSLEGMARWFMMFGDEAEVILPSKLKTRIIDLASEIKNKMKM